MTEALVAQANRAVSDPDQAWMLNEFIRYLQHPKSGAAEFEDMGASWVQVREAARGGSLRASDKGAVEVVRRYEQLITFAAMLMCRELGVEVRPALSRNDLKDPDRRLQAATAALAGAGVLGGSLRVPNAAAPIEITADLRASRVCCAMTIDAPSTGKPTTRLNWLLRQLRDSKPDVRVETITLRQRARGTVHTLAELRETPKLGIDDPAKEIRAFTVSLPANAGTKRGKGRGSFVASVLDSVDTFYAEVAQHIKPWTPPPVKVRDDEPPITDTQHTPELTPAPNPSSE